MKEREFKILKLLLNQKKLTLEYLSLYFNVSERTIRNSIEKIREEILSQNIGEIKVLKKECVLKIIDNKKISDLLYKYEEHSPEEVVDYLLLKVLSENRVNLTKECEILNLSRTTLKQYIKNLKIILEKYTLNLKISKEGLNLEGKEENVRRIGLRHIVMLLKKQDFLPRVTRDYFNKILMKNRIDMVEEVVSEIQIILKKVLSDLAYKNIISSFIITQQRINLNHYLLKEIDTPEKQYRTYSFNLVENMLNKYDFKFTLYEIYHLTDYFLGSYSGEKDISIYKNWVELEVKTKIFIEKISKEIKNNLSEDRLLYDYLIKDLKYISYNTNRDIKEKDFIMEDFKDILEKNKNIVEIVRKNIVEFDKILVSSIGKVELEMISYQIILSINRMKYKSLKIIKVLFISELGYGISKALAERLEEKFYIKIIAIIPIHRLKNYPKKDIDLILTNTFSKLQTDLNCIRISNVLSVQDADKIKKMGVGERSQKIFLSEIVSNISDKGEIGDEKLIIKLKEIFGSRLVDDLSIKNNKIKKLKLKIEKIDTWERLLEYLCEILIKRGSIEADYIENIKDTIIRFGEYLEIKEGIYFIHSKNRKGVKKSDWIEVKLENEIEFISGNKVSKVFLVVSLNDQDYLEIAEKIINEI
ncbi:MAG: BglG family transcription antiterminator [Clostridium sp.]|uniref:BglG family transcription antiterminator n=2 Tax=Bacteria TaxID=2 RepID=UPI003EE4CCFB